MALWSRDEVIRAVRQQMMRRGAFDNRVRVEDIIDDGTVLVLFRWKTHLSTFGVRFDFPGEAPSSELTGLPVDDVQEWAADLIDLLTEETATGFVGYAHRVRRDGFTELLWVPVTSRDPDFYVTTLDPAFAPMDWRERVARWASPAPRLQSRGQLVSWLKAISDHDRSDYLGQAVVGWELEPALLTARLEIVDVVAGNRADVFAALARGAIHAAADQGAEHMVTRLRNRTLADFGFRPIEASGDSTVDCADALIYPAEPGSQ